MYNLIIIYVIKLKNNFVHHSYELEIKKTKWGILPFSRLIPNQATMTIY